MAERPLFDRSGHIPELDGVRGIAIVLVVCFHSSVLMDGSSSLEQLWLGIVSVGWSGVDLFFVLSGFLITSILIQARGHSQYFRNFFMRRVLRVFPLYFGVLLLLFSLLAVPELHWWYYLFVQNWVPVFDGTYQPKALQPFWSLAVEEQFYLVWPIIIYMLRPKHVPLFCLVTAVAVLTARCIAKANHVDAWIIATVTPFRLDALALGALVASYRLGPQRERMKRLAPIVFLLSCGGLVAVLVMDSGYRMNGLWSQSVGYTLFAIVCAATIAMTISGHAYIALPCRLMRWSLLRRLGNRSFAIYVIHMPLFVFMNNVSHRKAANSEVSGSVDVQCFLFALALTLIVSEISWYLFENPFLRLKRFFPRCDESSDRTEAVQSFSTV